MLKKEDVLLIIYLIAVIVLVVIIGITFFIAFQKRKNKLLIEKRDAEQRFEDELVKSKLEIQEQTLKNVSWELHDNIGQLLSTAVMHINILDSSIASSNKEAMADVRELVGGSLQEIRTLSKTLNHEVIHNIGLEKSIQIELTRFKKLNFLNTKLDVIGEALPIDPKDEIILFRIVQEFFSNTMKHAEAMNLEVVLLFAEDSLTLTVKDDGKGFDLNNIAMNSGLLNMKSRAALINADFELGATQGKGVVMQLCYPIKRIGLNSN